MQCEDSRDKAFRVLSSFSGTCSIVPDYGMTSFDVAWLLVLKEDAAWTFAGSIFDLAVHLCHKTASMPK